MNVLVVLGKALQQGRISCEFAMRIAAAVAHLAVLRGRYQGLYFSGGRGEARAALECYQGRYGPCFPELAVATEEQSRNTVENVTAMAAMFNHLGPVRVDLLSSHYHLQRLQSIHAHLPGQSLLRPLLPYLDKLVPAPCYFEQLGTARLRRLARLHHGIDQLNYPRANIEALLAGRETRILPWALAAMDSVNALLSQEGTLVEHELLEDAVTELTDLQLALGRQAGNWNQGRLQHLKERLDALMVGLRTITDPDRIATGADWLAIERCLNAGSPTNG